MLKPYKFDYIVTRRLNQDSIENFFGIVRKQNGTCTHPDARQFGSSFSKLSILNIMDDCELFNCEPDEDTVMLADIELDDIDDNEDKNNNSSVLSCISNTHFNKVVPDDVDLSVLSYMSGFLYKKCLEKHKECQECVKLNTMENENFINLKTFTNCNMMKAPKCFTDFIEKLGISFDQIFNQIVADSGIGNTIYHILSKIELNINCTSFPKMYIVKLYIRLRICYYVKRTNEDVKTRKGREKLKKLN